MTQNEKIMLLHNIEAEHEVIAACISYENLWEAISPILQEQYFTDADARKAFGIIKQMEKEGK